MHVESGLLWMVEGVACPIKFVEDKLCFVAVSVPPSFMHKISSESVGELVLDV